MSEVLRKSVAHCASLLRVYSRWWWCRVFNRQLSVDDAQRGCIRGACWAAVRGCHRRLAGE